jgi:hypothetical protein
VKCYTYSSMRPGVAGADGDNKLLWRKVDDPAVLSGLPARRDHVGRWRSHVVVEPDLAAFAKQDGEPDAARPMPHATATASARLVVQPPSDEVA